MQGRQGNPCNDESIRGGFMKGKEYCDRCGKKLSRKDVFVFKFLKKYVPVKSLLIGRSAVYYLEGSEMKVFNDLVKRSDLKLNDRKLNLLRDNLKIMKGN